MINFFKHISLRTQIFLSMIINNKQRQQQEQQHEEEEEKEKEAEEGEEENSSLLYLNPDIARKVRQLTKTLR